MPTPDEDDVLSAGGRQRKHYGTSAMGYQNRNRTARNHPIQRAISPHKFTKSNIIDDFMSDGSGQQQYNENNAYIKSHQQIDITKLKSDYEETTNCMKLLQQFEDDFHMSKKEINKFDELHLEADTWVKVMQHCYKIIKDNIVKESPNFDKEKMELSIDQLQSNIKGTQKSLQTLKGEYFSINDLIVNQDSFQFKLDQVQYARTKQIEVYTKFESVEVQVVNNKGKMDLKLSDYHDFEKDLFHKLLNKTSIVVSKTDDLIEVIDQKMNNMTQEVTIVKSEVSQIIPHTRDHFEKINKVQKDITYIEKVLETADENMERNDQVKDKLHEIHNKCIQITNSLKPEKLVEMVTQTRQIEEIVKNFKEWNELYKKLKKLHEETIVIADFDLQKITQDSRKYVEQVQTSRKDEYEDFFKQVQKLSKRIRDQSDDQLERIFDFEEKNMNSEVAENIPDQDIVFLRKEVERYRGSLSAVLTHNENTLELANQIELTCSHEDQKTLDISPNDLHFLKQNLMSLKKLDEIDLPRIIKNIDLLEAFTLKTLKNKLNEDNKRSQGKIAKMKRNYEDLQKEIDQLNSKLSKVKIEANSFSVRLDNEDMEKDNQLKFKIEDKLCECDKDINGDKAAEKPIGSDDRGKDKPQSLQACKKEIITAINKMVNFFNENNKQIKDSNRAPKSEQEMNELIIKNHDIQIDCKQINDKIVEGKVFAKQIDERLNLILDPTIPQLEAKYEEKNGLIDNCDEYFDKCETKFKQMEGAMNDDLDKIDAIILLLEEASPISNPSSSYDENQDYVEEISKYIDQAYELREQLESIFDKVIQNKDKLMEIIQPLNELGDREVKIDEISKILDALKLIYGQLKDAELKYNPLKKDSDHLQKFVKALLEGEKERKIQGADVKYGELEKAMDDLVDAKRFTTKKDKEYAKMINDATQNEALEDPQLQGKLNKLDKDENHIQIELKDIDEKQEDIKRKHDEARKMIDDVYSNPDNFSGQEIDGMIDGIGDLKDKLDSLIDRDQKIDLELDRLIEDLLLLLEKSNEKRKVDNQLKDFSDQLRQGLGNLKILLRTQPEQIDGIINTLNEMKNGSLPDKSADYWEEREDIDKWLNALTDTKQSLQVLDEEFKYKDTEVKDLIIQSNKNIDIEQQKLFCNQLQNDKTVVDKLLERAYDFLDVVNSTLKEMNDCQIPCNIVMRANEISHFSQRLQNIQIEFKDLKQSDDDYEGTVESEREIKLVIEKIDKKLKVFEQEKKDYQKYQKSKLETLKEKEIFGLNNYQIIIDIREFKAKIQDSNVRLNELDELMRDLSTKLILQDMVNALKLLERKKEKLGDRLNLAQDELKKIDECGKDMEGNTSQSEEDEFIDALKDEMPEVFKNIDSNFEQLEIIDDMIKEVLDTKSIDKMQDLKKDIDDISNKVDQCEGLVNKLENEITEWEAYKKLVRRDEELGEIDNLINDFSKAITEDKTSMATQLDKYDELLNKQPNNKELNQIVDELNDFMEDIEKMEDDIDYLKTEKDECFQKFDGDLPKNIKQAREKRIANLTSPRGRKRSFPMIDLVDGSGDNPSDMYYMLKINSKYKGRIHEIIKNIRNLNGNKREFDDKYAPLIAKLNIKKVNVDPTFKAYKPQKGDPIDELFAKHLNAHQLNLPIKRLGPGQYMFGSRKILAKIINGKLVIRVGGGYMSADEFIEQYGPIEMIKLMKMQEREEQTGNFTETLGSPNRGSMPRNSKAVGMADMKELMKQQMNQIKTYTEGPVNNFGGFNQPKRGSNVSKNVVDLKTLEVKYESAQFGLKSSRSPDNANRRQTTMFNSNMVNQIKAFSGAQTSRTTQAKPRPISANRKQ